MVVVVVQDAIQACLLGLRHSEIWCNNAKGKEKGCGLQGPDCQKQCPSNPKEKNSGIEPAILIGHMPVTIMAVAWLWTATSREVNICLVTMAVVWLWNYRYMYIQEHSSFCIAIHSSQSSLDISSLWLCCQNVIMDMHPPMACHLAITNCHIHCLKYKICFIFHEKVPWNPNFLTAGAWLLPEN